MSPPPTVPRLTGQASLLTPHRPDVTKRAEARRTSGTVSFSLPPIAPAVKSTTHGTAQKRNITFLDPTKTEGAATRNNTGSVDSKSTLGIQRRNITFVESIPVGSVEVGGGFEPGTLAAGEAGTMSSTMIYRSVPPRPLSYTFSDVMETSLEQGRGTSRRSKSRSKTAPVSTNAPEEYAERFKARPTTRPAVIDFNGTTVKLTSARATRKPYHGFPPVKLTSKHVPGNGSHPQPKTTANEIPLTERGVPATSTLHLAPLTKGAEPDSALSFHSRPYRPPPPLHTPTPKRHSKTPELSRFHGIRSAASSIKSRDKSSTSSQRFPDKSVAGSQHGKGVHGTDASNATGADTWQGELSSSKLSTLDALGFAVTMSANGEQLCLPDVLARSDDFDDLSELPRPKRILPRRDVPWVFRFKVKKEMNALARIMASKPTDVGPLSAATGPTA